MGISSTINLAKEPIHIDIASQTTYRSGRHLFFSFFTKNYLILSVSILLNLFSSIAQLIPAIIIGKALGILVVEGFSQNFIFTALILLAVGALNYVFSFVSNYSFAITAFAFERDIRQEYFDKIQEHSLTFHDENNSSKLLSLGMTEISQIRMGLNPSMRLLIQSLFSMIFVLYFMTNIFENQIIWITAAVFVIYYIFAYRYARSIAPVRRKLAESIGELTESSQEIFRGIEVVRSLSSREREITRFNGSSTNYANLYKKEQQLSAFYFPALLLIIYTVYLFWVSLTYINAGKIILDDVITAIGLLFTLQRINFMIPMALLNIQAAFVNADRLWQKMNWRDPNPELSNLQSDIYNNINWDNNLAFHHVDFSYGNGLTLEDITVTIPAHSKVAVIGGPGSGKSTFLKLLLNLYAPTGGEILIDGVDFSQIPSDVIRNHVSRVEQEVFLFSGTIRDNIAFANKVVTDEQIEEAAKAAHAFEFISKMPKGLQTKIGERGITLSGGQKQRLAIARAILANPNILLLDDSSSALDSKTEMLIRQALENLSRGRITFTVTQRLNTLVRADLIILLSKGKILAKGTHSELLKSCKEYQQIFTLLPESEQLLNGGEYHE